MTTRCSKCNALSFNDTLCPKEGCSKATSNRVRLIHWFRNNDDTDTVHHGRVSNTKEIGVHTSGTNISKIHVACRRNVPLRAGTFDATTSIPAVTCQRCLEIYQSTVDGTPDPGPFLPNFTAELPVPPRQTDSGPIPPINDIGTPAEFSSSANPQELVDRLDTIVNDRLNG